MAKVSAQWQGLVCVAVHQLRLLIQTWPGQTGCLCKMLLAQTSMQASACCIMGVSRKAFHAFSMCRTMPMRPDQLTGIAEQEKYGVAVFKRKQLPVKPGLSERQLGAMLQAYSI